MDSSEDQIYSMLIPSACRDCSAHSSLFPHVTTTPCSAASGYVVHNQAKGDRRPHGRAQAWAAGVLMDGKVPDGPSAASTHRGGVVVERLARHTGAWEGKRPDVGSSNAA